jgi:hypothetical protein
MKRHQCHTPINCCCHVKSRFVWVTLYEISLLLIVVCWQSTHALTSQMLVGRTMRIRRRRHPSALPPLPIPRWSYTVLRRNARRSRDLDDVGEDNYDNNDDNNNDDRSGIFARIRRQRQRNYYDDDNDDVNDGDDDDQYGDSAKYDNFGRRVADRFSTRKVFDRYDNDEDDDEDYEDGEDSGGIFDNVLIPNPLLDNIDPDGAAERFPELAQDPKFWFDMLLFVAFINFMSSMGPRSPITDLSEILSQATLPPPPGI